MNPRKPKGWEKGELLALFLNKFSSNGLEEQERDAVIAMIERAAISVFDDYVSDSPVYAGKVMVVVWPGDPAFTDTYIWEKTDEGISRLREVTGEAKFHAGLFTYSDLEAILQALRHVQKANPERLHWYTLTEKRIMNILQKDEED